MKSLMQSKTFWIAVIQAVAGVVVVALTQLDLVGYVAVFKSLVDIVLRLITTEPIDRLSWLSVPDRIPVIMSFIPHTIATVVFALFIPSTTASDIHIPEPDPLPEPAAHVVTPPKPELEGKPLPSEPPRVKPSACNCYNILKENFDSVPSMNQLMATASPVKGNVAVFRYPATPDWPNGIPHVAVVRGELPDGSLQIEEYNYHSCTHSFRAISPTDHRLVGFVSL